MGRYDGTKPMNLSPYKIVEPYAISTRTGAQVFFQATYDLVKTLPYIEKYNKDRRLDKTNRLTLFHVILCAAARGIAKYPHLNRFISGRKYYQRNRLNFSFVVKKQLTPNAPESIAKVDLSPYETLDTIRNVLHANIRESRTDEGGATEDSIQLYGKMPRFVLMLLLKIVNTLDFWGILPKDYIEKDPLFASSFVANLGSVGLEGKMNHHLYDYGNVSSFCLIGKIHKAPVIVENDEIAVHKVVDVGYTIDERISGGAYFTVLLKYVQELVENPERLMEKPTYTQKQIEELALVDLKTFKPYLKMRAKQEKKHLKHQKKREKAKLKRLKKESMNNNNASDSEYVTG